MDNQFDIILGMSWLKKHQPIIDWNAQSVIVNGKRLSTVEIPTSALVLQTNEGGNVNKSVNASNTTTPREAKDFRNNLKVNDHTRKYEEVNNKNSYSNFINKNQNGTSGLRCSDIDPELGSETIRVMVVDSDRSLQRPRWT